LEKGEVAILSIQFGALILAVLFLSGFASSSSGALSTPQITSVYWGAPPPGNGTSIGHGTNDEATNATSMSFFYNLAESTHLVSVSASRFCINPQANATAGGAEDTFTHIPWYYSSDKKSYYFTFSPTGQPTGWTCEYSIAITDSLAQTTTWVGTVVVKPATAIPS
jgi:hypothetical protein